MNVLYKEKMPLGKGWSCNNNWNKSMEPAIGDMGTRINA
jgi:hypothetical protein